MIKVVLYKGRNNRTGEVNLRFRVQDGKVLDMLYDTHKGCGNDTKRVGT